MIDTLAIGFVGRVGVLVSVGLVKNTTGFFEKLLCLLLESLNDSLGFVLVTNCIIKCSKC